MRPADAEPTSEVNASGGAADDGSVFGRGGMRLREGWRWLVMLSMAGLALALVAGLIIPRQYEGAALLMVVPPRREAQAAPPLTRFRLLAESNTLTAEVVDELKLRELSSLTPQQFRERALAVDEVRGTNLLRIRVRLTDPRVAASVCNALADKLVKFQLQLDLGGAETMAASLKEQLAQAERKLRTAEDRFGGYNAKAQIELTQEDTNSRLTQRAALVPLLIDLESEKARLRAAEAEIKSHAPVLSVPRLVGAEQALADQRVETQARQKDGQLRATVVRSAPTDVETGQNPIETDGPTSQRAAAGGPENESRRQALRRREPETRIEEPIRLDTTNPFVNPVYSTLQYEIATARTRLAGLERRKRELIDVLKVGGAELNQITILHEKQLEAARRETDVDVARRIHSELSMQYEEARLTAVTGATTLQVVDRAVPPDGAVWPNLPLFGALGLLLGFSGGAIGLIATELRARSRGTA